MHAQHLGTDRNIHERTSLVGHLEGQPPDGDYQVVAVGTDNVTNTSGPSTSIPVTVDNTGPTGSVTYTNGYVTTTAVSVSFSATAVSGINATTGKLMRRTATLSAADCGAFGSYVQVGSTGLSSPYNDTTVVSGYCYQYEYVVSDYAGSQATITSSDTAEIDTTAPSIPVLIFSTGTNVIVSGTYVYYRPGATSGGFTVTASSTDSESGIASYNFPSLGTGWTATPGGLGIETYTWNASNPTTASGSLPVTATDGAGLTSSGSNSQNPFTMVADSTAPGGGALTANATAASSGGSSSYLTSGTTLTINSRTDYTETQSPTQSGLATSTLTIQSATLTNNSCGPYGSTTTINGTSSQTVASGYCYQLTLTGIDNVGNVASISTVVKVDTTAPVLTITTGGSNVYYSGSGTTVYFKSGGSGSFTITATDPETGIATTTFPAAPSGWTESPGTNSLTYTSTVRPRAARSTGVSAKNNAGSTTSENVTITVDTGPTGGALTVNGVAATSGGSTSSTSSTSFSIGSRTDYTDGGSGLKSSTLTVQSETFTNNTCGSAGSGGPFTTATTITGTTQPGGILADFCYLYTLTGTDNVGNTASISTTVQVLGAASQVVWITQPTTSTAGVAIVGPPRSRSRTRTAIR